MIDVEHHLVLSMLLIVGLGTLGLVTHRNNEVQNAFGDFASLVWAPLIKEPVVHDGFNSADKL